MRRIFFSPLGLRTGWSLALFLFLYSALTLSVQFSFATVPALRDWAARQPHGVSPFTQIEFTGLELVILLISAFITSRVEKRPLSLSGLAGQGRGMRRFFQGGIVGLLMASALVGIIAFFGGYTVQAVALGRHEIVQNAFLYGLGFLLVGFFEEFAFRGFLQNTLQRGLGVWPSAMILSLAFGAVHLPGLSGVWIAAVVAFSFGLLAVFSCLRTGSLWFIVGCHAAFDWAIAFFYSAPIAGQPAQGHLLDVIIHGPEWFTGGRAGPVGSVFSFPIFGLTALAIYFFFPSNARTATNRFPMNTIRKQQYS